MLQFMCIFPNDGNAAGGLFANSTITLPRGLLQKIEEKN